MTKEAKKWQAKNKDFEGKPIKEGDRVIGSKDDLFVRGRPFKVPPLTKSEAKRVLARHKKRMAEYEKRMAERKTS